LEGLGGGLALARVEQVAGNHCPCPTLSSLAVDRHHILRVFLEVLVLRKLTPNRRIRKVEGKEERKRKSADHIEAKRQNDLKRWRRGKKKKKKKSNETEKRKEKKEKREENLLTSFQLFL
jgi:hypothetical protein